MKKSLISAILALSGFAAVAAPVSQQKAADIAGSYVSQQTGAPAGLKVRGVEKLDGMYLVNFSPVGFALVSADDNAEPIIGFSTESNLMSYDIPENMGYILKEASDVVALQARQGTLNRKWQTIESGVSLRAASRAGEEPVDPLIKVNWNQGNPYNKFCPGEDKNKAVVGCVAVAMSQAMSVQQYPVKPTGQKSYAAPGYGLLSIDYEAEKPYNWPGILDGSDIDDRARLLYHAGVSVEMGYGADGSGIPSNQVYRITNALKNHFGYSNDVAYYWRKDYNGDWAQLLLNELYAGHALVYNAIDTKGGYGHSFNIDGYNGYLFHLNWGWGGTGNGWFSIDALADAAMGMNYDSNHVVVTGIGAANKSVRNVDLSDLSVEENLPTGSPVAAVLVNGVLPTSDMKVTLTGAYVDGSYGTVPFAYKDGMVTTTRSLSLSEGPIYLRVVVEMKNESSDKLSQGFNIEVEKPQSIQKKSYISYDRATKTFTVHTKYGATYTVKNAQGATVLTGAISTVPEFQFRRDQLTTGRNTVEITVGGVTHTFEIVK